MAQITFKVTVHVDLVPTAGLTVTLMSLANANVQDADNLPAITDSSGEVTFTDTNDVLPLVGPTPRKRSLQVVRNGIIGRFDVYSGHSGPNRINVSTVPFRISPDGAMLQVNVITYLTKITVLNSADDVGIANAAVYAGKELKNGAITVRSTNASGVAYIQTTECRADFLSVVTVSGYSPRYVEFVLLEADNVIKLDAKPAQDGDGSHALVVQSSIAHPDERAVIRNWSLGLGVTGSSAPGVNPWGDLLMDRLPGGIVPVTPRSDPVISSLPSWGLGYAVIFWLTSPGDDATIISGPVQGNNFGIGVLHCKPSTSYHLWSSLCYEGNQNARTAAPPREVTTGSGAYTVVHLGRA